MTYRQLIDFIDLRGLTEQATASLKILRIRRWRQ